jgi:hypothetical protein
MRRQIFQHNVIHEKSDISALRKAGEYFNAEISNVSCILIHYAMLKYLMSHVFWCNTQCWNVWFLMSSHALRNDEISDVSCILMQNTMLKYLISHVFPCITQCWHNIWETRYFSITYYRWKQIFQYNVIMRKRVFLQNVMHDNQTINKYLTSHALRNAEMSDF